MIGLPIHGWGNNIWYFEGRILTMMMILMIRVMMMMRKRMILGDIWGWCVCECWYLIVRGLDEAVAARFAKVCHHTSLSPLLRLYFNFNFYLYFSLYWYCKVTTPVWVPSCVCICICIFENSFHFMFLKTKWATSCPIWTSNNCLCSIAAKTCIQILLKLSQKSRRSQ